MKGLLGGDSISFKKLLSGDSVDGAKVEGADEKIICFDDHGTAPRGEKFKMVWEFKFLG